MKIFIADDLAGFTDGMRDIVQHWLKNSDDDTAEIAPHATPVRIVLSSLTKATGDVTERRGADVPNPDLIAQPEFSSAILDAIGAELLHLGHVEQAATFIDAALRGRTKLYGPDHPITAESFNTRARLRRLQGELGSAEDDVRRALATNSRVYGADSYATSMNLTELAAVQLQAGEYAAAEKSVRRGLSILEALYLDADPNATRLLDSLARVYVARGCYREAVEIYERILPVDLKQLGPCNLKYGTHLANFAVALHYLGNLADAARYFQTAIDVYAVKGGVPNNPDLVDIRSAYAALLLDLGNPAEAKEQLTKVIDSGIRIRGANHMNVGNDYVGRARIFYELGELSAAKDDLERALAVFAENVEEQRIAADHVFVAEAKTWSARILVESAAGNARQRAGRDAEQLVEPALRIFQAEFADDSVEVAICGAVLARALTLQNKESTRAKELLTAALAVVVAGRGADSKIARLILAWLDELVGRVGRSVTGEGLAGE